MSDSFFQAGPVPSIIDTTEAVEKYLRQHVGVSLGTLRSALRVGHSEAAMATEHSAATSYGFRMWDGTMRELRDRLSKRGWQTVRPGQLEAVRRGDKQLHFWRPWVTLACVTVAPHLRPLIHVAHRLTLRSSQTNCRLAMSLQTTRRTGSQFSLGGSSIDNLPWSQHGCGRAVTARRHVRHDHYGLGGEDLLTNGDGGGCLKEEANA